MDFWYQYRGPVEKLWPRRLLHITSLTSFEWQEGNIYGGIAEPKYSIISYTWGRFAIKNPPQDVPRLNVQGVTWKIPAIDPNHFTADAFCHMIQQTRQISKNDFVWLDVACIDQEHYPTKMAEVGRQAGIFANAGMAFVWLWTVPTEVITDGWAQTETTFRRFTGADEGALNLKEAQVLDGAISRLLKDPWFSSLWTLQEERLRTEALLLSREGVTAASVDDVQYTLSFMHLALNINTMKLASNRDPQIEQIAQNVRKLIREAGYNTVAGTNPNIGFTTAYNRKATVELDRVYGIVALYNIHVGATVPGADVNRKYTLEELQDEFVIALNAKSLFLGQLFLHIAKPNDTWRITQNARVPEGFEDWDEKFITDIKCALSVSPGQPARIRGMIDSFQSLITYWQARLPQLTRVNPDYHLTVAVDDYICREQPLLPCRDPYDLEFRNTSGNFPHTEATVNGLLETWETSRLSVLKLGVESAGGGRPDVFHAEFGLLLLHDEHDRSRCQRIGLCRWEGGFFDYTVSEKVKNMKPRFEEEYEGEIY